MKVFLILIVAVFGMHHFLKQRDGFSSSSEGSVERGRKLLPAAFKPSQMTASQREGMRTKLTSELAKVERFIANPPI